MSDMSVPPRNSDIGDVTTLPKIAVLGTGVMGTGIITRLVFKGFTVSAWNRSVSGTSEAKAAGARITDTAAGAVAASDVVMISVSNHLAVAAVLEQALEAENGRGVPIVDLTTMPPHESRSLAKRFGDLYITCPIFATPRGAGRGKATILTAGSAASRPELAKVWDALSIRHQHFGDDNGLASGLKLMTNYLHLSAIAQLACAVETGRAWGLDDEVITDWLTTNPAVAASALPRLSQMMDGGRDSGYPQDHAVDALRLASAGAANASTQLIGSEQISELYARSSDIGTEHFDVSAVVRSVRLDRQP
jgi:3-hydroxyisobutyrate dehydrogenase